MEDATAMLSVELEITAFGETVFTDLLENELFALLDFATEAAFIDVRIAVPAADALKNSVSSLEEKASLAGKPGETEPVRGGSSE